MFVPVMDVGIVGMGVDLFLVLVRVAVRFSRWVVGRVFVLVVFIMDMAVFMLHRFVCMLMFVSLCKVQPDADAHERSRHTEENGESFLEDYEREQGPDERCEREISTSPSGP
jgi:hypothetical protein